jgi:hypothetical protein
MLWIRFVAWVKQPETRIQHKQQTRRWFDVESFEHKKDINIALYDCRVCVSIHGLTVCI